MSEPLAEHDGSTDRTTDDTDSVEIGDEVESLRAENERLRAEVRRVTRTRYRRQAMVLVALGLLWTGGAFVFPDVASVLHIVGAIGLFGGILTWYLTPDAVLSVSVLQGLFDAHADTADRLIEELGLQSELVYVPVDGEAVARLYVPLHSSYHVPADDALDRLFVVTDDEDERGIAVPPTGVPLYRSFQGSVAGPGEVVDLPTLIDGVVEQFELAAAADFEVGEGRATVTLSDPAMASADRIDHPAVSFLGTGLAVTLGQSVRRSRVRSSPSEVVVTFEWDRSE